MSARAHANCRELLGPIPIPVLLVSGEGEVLFANRAATSALGYEPSSLVNPEAPGDSTDPALGQLSGLLSEASKRGEASKVIALPNANRREGAHGFHSGLWNTSVSSDGESWLITLVPADFRTLDPGVEELSPREMQALGFAADGAGAKETAFALGISKSTVPQHLASAKQKLSARNRSEAVARAVAEGRLRPRRSGEGAVGLRLLEGSPAVAMPAEVVYLSGAGPGLSIGQVLDLAEMTTQGSTPDRDSIDSGTAVGGPLGLVWNEVEGDVRAHRELFGPHERVFVAHARRDRVFFLLEQLPGI